MQSLAEPKQRLLARIAQRLAHDLNNDLTVIQAQTELATRQPELRLQHRLDAIRSASAQIRKRSRMVQALAQAPARNGRALSIPQAMEDIEIIASLVLGRRLSLQMAGELTAPHHLDQAQLRLLTALVMLACVDAQAASESDSALPNARLELLSRQGQPVFWFTLVDGQPPSWLQPALQAMELQAAAGEGEGDAGAGAFELWLALAECKPPHDDTDQATPPLTEPADNAAPRLLVVDDEADVRHVLVQALKRQYEVLDAGNIKDAMRQADRAGNLDMLITDARLEGSEDGLSLAAALRESWPGLPVIVVSGMPQDPQQPLPRDCLWLEKPVSLRTLRASVQQLLRSAQADDTPA